MMCDSMVGIAVDDRRDLGVTCVFFFQAEDGIRDSPVTGVQTCALPILVFRKRRNMLKIC